jgi:sugar phosphate isomerase/epimerase
MELGIFAKTFVRPSLGDTLDAVEAHGLTCIQFNMACVGLPPLPDAIEPAITDRITRALSVRKLRMAAVSGTFNMIHPDKARRLDNLARLEVLASACRPMGTSIITLCTGTRDPDDMWRRHPDNDKRAAWHDLVESLDYALKIAEEHDVILAFEPERANVIDTTAKARRLLDEVGSPRLKVVLDPINLLSRDDLPRMRSIVEEACAALGDDIVIAHAKDKEFQQKDAPVATGRGVLDFDLFLRRLRRHAPEVPLILHGIEESQVAESVAFLRRKAESLAGPD